MATSKTAARITLPYHFKWWSNVEPLLVEVQSCASLEQAFKLLAKIFSIAVDEPILNFNQTPYCGLGTFFQKRASKEEQDSFLKESLPAIAVFAIRGEQLQPNHCLPLCTAQTQATVTLHRSFVASLIALGFLCLLPEDDLEESTSLNFSTFLQPLFYQSRMPAQCSKLRFVLNYFRRLHKMEYEVPGFITYRRIVQKSELKKKSLEESNTPLCDFTVDSEKRIEDSGSHTLQMDFANEYIGGGVLGGGNVQEEIRFTVCPELLASMLFMQRMEPNEAIIIQGFEQFSEYSNYGNKLQFAHDLQDPSERDANGDILTTLSAIDAIPYPWGSYEQYKLHNILRDINKAYIGFLQPYLHDDSAKVYINQRRTEAPKQTAKAAEKETKKTESQQQSSEKLNKAVESVSLEKGAVSGETSQADASASPTGKRTVATGNWGCGAFGGNPQLKSMLQWISASEAGCPQIIYYTFGNDEVQHLDKVVQVCKQKQLNVGTLFKEIDQFCVMKYKEGLTQNLFDFLLRKEGKM